MARGHCRRRGWRILRTNWRFADGEIDLLAADEQGRWVVVEVRGRADFAREPSRYLTPCKAQRLLRMATRLAIRHRRSVRVELVEVIGRVPRPMWARIAVMLMARWWAPGFRLRAWSVEA